jgi:hypothetical protein
LAAEPLENEGDLAFPPRGRYQQLNDVSFLAAWRITSARSIPFLFGSDNQKIPVG